VSSGRFHANNPGVNTLILTTLPAWMIASFLRLPPNPELAADATPSQVDLEHQFAKELGPVDDRSYQKAMWWRNLNRIMAAVGTLLIGVIVRSTFASRYLLLTPLFR
jgi:hypothetical protein